MANDIYCRVCGKFHKIGDCNVKPVKVKKPWVKPVLKKFHVFKAVSLTETKEEALDRLKPDGVSLTGFDRRTYQREYMRGYKRNKAKA